MEVTHFIEQVKIGVVNCNSPILPIYLLDKWLAAQSFNTICIFKIKPKIKVNKDKAYD